MNVERGSLLCCLETWMTSLGKPVFSIYKMGMILSNSSSVRSKKYVYTWIQYLVCDWLRVNSFSLLFFVMKILWLRLKSKNIKNHKTFQEILLIFWYILFHVLTLNFRVRAWFCLQHVAAIVLQKCHLWEGSLESQKSVMSVSQ